jgi:hypothetical protein
MQEEMSYPPHLGWFSSVDIDSLKDIDDFELGLGAPPSRGWGSVEKVFRVLVDSLMLEGGLVVKICWCCGGRLWLYIGMLVSGDAGRLKVVCVFGCLSGRGFRVSISIS